MYQALDEVVKYAASKKIKIAIETEGSLKKKGHIKLKNFQNNKNKINYIYILTPRGLAIKTKLTVNFMKRKMKEYDELSRELKKQ